MNITSFINEARKLKKLTQITAIRQGLTNIRKEQRNATLSQDIAHLFEHMCCGYIDRLNALQIDDQIIGLLQFRLQRQEKLMRRTEKQAAL